MTTGSVGSSALPLSTALVSAGGVSAPTPAASQDFILMLSQLVGQGGEMPIAPPAALQPNAAVAQELEEMRADEGAGLAALLAFLSATPVVNKYALDASAAAANTAAVIGALPNAQQAVAKSTATNVLMDQLTEVDSTVDASEGDVPPFSPAVQDAANTSRPPLAADAVLARPVQAPVGSAAWSDEIGARLTLMTEQGKHSASLRLSPEHLGPLEVRIAVNDDRATVWFGAAHADTRAAIEQALPRLRELFEAQGMSLTDAGVFRDAPREQPKPQTITPGHDDAAAAEDRTVTIAKARLGLVDAYA